MDVFERWRIIFVAPSKLHACNESSPAQCYVFSTMPRNAQENALIKKGVNDVLVVELVKHIARSTIVFVDSRGVSGRRWELARRR